ncbi:MAG: DUF1772 domain-containing protein [Thermoleophilia bacterium]|nr:DUF1772 domain-containing protein [Thermoleophilia bacterium]
MGGVFLAFSSFVMPALGDLPPAQGLAAMQSINRAAVTPVFMTELFGTALGCAVLCVVAARSWGEPFSGRLLAGGLTYLVGVIVMTIAFHVPRNDRLAELAAGDPGAAAAWSDSLSQWTAGNHVRAIAGLAAAALLADALRVGAA